MGHEHMEVAITHLHKFNSLNEVKLYMRIAILYFENYSYTCLCMIHIHICVCNSQKHTHVYIYIYIYMHIYIYTLIAQKEL